MFSSIFWILQKELRYALRDTDVLIYSVLVPIVIYPLFIIGAGEVVLWQITSAQHYKVCLGDTKLPPYLDKALREIKGLEFEKSTSPLQDLKKGKLDVVLSGTEPSDKYDIVCTVGSKRGVLAASNIRSQFLNAQATEQAHTYHKYQVPDKILTVFSAQQTRLVPISPQTGAAAVEANSPILLMVAVMIGLMQAGLVAGVTAVCMFAEEREKKTFETTMSLPVSAYGLTVGKWLAATALTIGSAILYIVSVSASYAVIVFQTITTQKLSADELTKSMVAEPASIALAVLTVILAAGVSCALCMLCVSSCKTFKDAQAISMYPMLMIVSLPMIALIPGIEQYSWANFIPFTNMLLSLKHPQAGLLNLVLGLTESLAITLASLYFASRIFFSEKSMSVIGEITGTKSSQQQSESV